MKPKLRLPGGLSWHACRRGPRNTKEKSNSLCRSATPVNIFETVKQHRILPTEMCGSQATSLFWRERRGLGPFATFSNRFDSYFQELSFAIQSSRGSAGSFRCRGVRGGPTGRPPKISSGCPVRVQYFHNFSSLFSFLFVTSVVCHSGVAALSWWLSDHEHRRFRRR